MQWFELQFSMWWGTLPLTRNESIRTNPNCSSSAHSLQLSSQVYVFTYQVVWRRKRKMAGKTRSSLPTDQRRRNTTIPGMASGSEEDHWAQYSPSVTEVQTQIKPAVSSHHSKRGRPHSYLTCSSSRPELLMTFCAVLPLFKEFCPSFRKYSDDNPLSEQ